MFLLNPGVRNGELCSLNIEDLRIDDHEQLVYVVGKSLKERWVPLNRAALAAVRLHLRSRGNPKSGPLFVTRANTRYKVRQLANEIVKTARCFREPVNVNPHNLWYTFATWLARSTSNIAMVQKVLGHESVNTTFRYYIHSSDGELCGATANLRRRKAHRHENKPDTESSFGVIPFPNRWVG